MNENDQNEEEDDIGPLSSEEILAGAEEDIQIMRRDALSALETLKCVTTEGFSPEQKASHEANLKALEGVVRVTSPDARQMIQQFLEKHPEASIEEASRILFAEG